MNSRPASKTVTSSLKSVLDPVFPLVSSVDSGCQSTEATVEFRGAEEDVCVVWWLSRHGDVLCGKAACRTVTWVLRKEFSGLTVKMSL